MSIVDLLNVKLLFTGILCFLALSLQLRSVCSEITFPVFQHCDRLCLILLCDAPAQGILVIFIAAAHNDALQITVKHDMNIYYIFQPGNAGCVECNTVLSDHNRQITKVRKKLFSHDLVSVI